MAQKDMRLATGDSATGDSTTWPLSSKVAAVALSVLLASSACDDSTKSSGDNGGDQGTAGDASTGATDTPDDWRATWDGAVPVESAQLQAYLEARDYADFAAESTAHESEGAHFGNVRSFVSSELMTSLEGESTEHPVGSAVIKELFGDGTLEVRGYSVMVKIQEGFGGESWYFYEIYDGEVYADEVASSGCVSCHQQGNRDFFQGPYPLP